MTKCLGCGIKLQTSDKNKVGYTPKENATMCERCFRLKNYNEFKEIDLKNINNKIITKINKEANLTLFLIDFLNINEETINTYHEITSPKVLVVSKKDVIPSSIKEATITSFLKRIYHIKEDIYYISSKKNYNLTKIIDLIKNTKDLKAYTVGYTNSGKSTLINAISSKIGKESQITTSSIPNTTLDFIIINLDEIKIIDSPGFTLNNNIYDKKEYELIKKINPKSFLKPVTIQTKDNTRILIENKICLYPSNKNSFTFYMSNNINIEKIYKEGLTGANKTIIKIEANSDLIIKGLGFINIKKECQLQINTNYLDLIEVRPSLFNKENLNE